MLQLILISANDQIKRTDISVWPPVDLFIGLIKPLAIFRRVGKESDGGGKANLGKIYVRVGIRTFVLISF